MPEVGLLAGILGGCPEIGEHSRTPLWRKTRPPPASQALRHPVFGTYVCLAVGLPEEIAHIACAHSLEVSTSASRVNA